LHNFWWRTWSQTWHWDQVVLFYVEVLVAVIPVPEFVIAPAGV
jgi:hypothetical protein